MTITVKIENNIEPVAAMQLAESTSMIAIYAWPNAPEGSHKFGEIHPKIARWTRTPDGLHITIGTK